MSETAVTLSEEPGAITAQTMESVVMGGDLSVLTPLQRVIYYRKVCESIGLNPLTKPFEYIRLNNKLTLYALKGCADQLRSLPHNKVSIYRLDKEVIGDIYAVTAYARTADGRTDSDLGTVAVKGLAGDALANAMLKATTKAKRRVTLSICGLGWLDESEVETIPERQSVHVDMDTGAIEDVPPKPPDLRAERIAELKRTAAQRGLNSDQLKGFIQSELGKAPTALTSADADALIAKLTAHQDADDGETIPFDGDESPIAPRDDLLKRWAVAWSDAIRLFKAGTWPEVSSPKPQPVHQFDDEALAEAVKGLEQQVAEAELAVAK